jgi:hypothetical protein
MLSYKRPHIISSCGAKLKWPFVQHIRGQSSKYEMSRTNFALDFLSPYFSHFIHSSLQYSLDRRLFFFILLATFSTKKWQRCCARRSKR